MPRRRSLRRARDRALALALRLLSWPFGALPWRAAQRCGEGVGRAGWIVARRDRRRTLEHLALAFPEASSAVRHALGRACFAHWGASLAEALHLLARHPDTILRHVDVEGWQHVDTARAAGRAILVLTGHCGNWEAITAYLPRRGLDIAAIARRLDEPALDRLLVSYRSRFGTRTIARGSRESSRQLREVARGRAALAVLIDQDTKVEGAWVPFFGRPAFTPTGAAHLARRLDAVVLPMFIERQPAGRHLLRVEPPLDLPPDPVQATARMTERIEAQIRRRPEQWVWMHRRWRRQPAGAAAPVALIALLALLLGGSLGSSGCRPAARSTGAWQRFDLWATPPRVEVQPRRVAAPYETLVTNLGLAEVRDMTQVPASQLAHFPRRTAGQVRALAQTRGSRLAWRIDLGTEAYLSFVPLGADGECEYRVSARDAQGRTAELGAFPAPTATRSAPAVIEIDLAPFAAQSIDLLLEVRRARPPAAGAPDPPVEGRALWGTPQVWSRRPPTVTTRPGSPSAPNILLVGLDTLRADAIGRRSGRPSLTPAWDRLAAEADVWTAAFSTFNSTNPSFASILTGLYGKNHGVYDLATRLAPEHVTLAELFSAAGYRTGAVVSASHLGDHNSGLRQGFDEMVTSSEHHAAEMAVDLLLDWLEPSSPRPFFAFLHLFDPHTPHTPPAPYSLGERPNAPHGLERGGAWTAFRDLGPRTFTEPVLGGERDLYDGEVAYLDRQLDRLIDWLDSRGWLETTLVVLVADHGENLGDHGIQFRHVGLWDSTTHVPLVIRRPGAARPGRLVPTLVQTIDLFPTLLGAAGLDRRAAACDGIDLGELTGDGRPGRRAVFAEHAGGLGAMVRTADWKLVRSAGNRSLPDGVSLYDLRADPGEKTNLAGRGLREEERLGRLLDAWAVSRRPAPGRPAPIQLTPEEREKLRALGYL